MRKATSVDPLGGTLLRYAICVAVRRRTMSVADIVAAIQAWGFTLPEHANTAVADAVRWEVRKGRVTKPSRGVYGAGQMPRTTWHRMQQRVAAAQATVAGPEAVRVPFGGNSLRGGTREEPAFDAAAVYDTERGMKTFSR